MRYFRFKNYFDYKTIDSSKNILLIILIHIIILPVLSLYNNSPDLNKFYSFPLFHSLIFSIILFIFSSFFILFIFKFLFSEKIIFFVLKYILLWSFLIGIFFPILGAGDGIIVDFLKIDFFPRSRLFLAILLTLLKIIAIFYFTNFLINKKSFIAFRVFITVALVLNFFLYSFLINNREPGLNLEKISKYSNTENLITLSFDGISNISFRTGIKNNKKFLNAFKDFSFYNNINGHSTGTYTSLVYELYGGFDEKIDYKKFNQKDVFNYVESKRLIIQDEMYVNQTYGQYSDFFKGNVSKFYSPSFHNTSKSDYFYFFFKEVTIPSFARTMSHLLVANILSPFLYIAESQKYLFNKNKNLTTTNLKSYEDFLFILNNLEIDTTKNKIIKFFHFNFSHSPVEIDKNCEIKHYDENWIKLTSFKQKDLEISECLLNKLTGYLEKLKHEGLYDNSTIIIKSDHGREKDYYEDFPENIEINNNKNFSYGRYNPLLMIKKKNVSNRQIQFYDHEIYSRDLNKMYCFFLEQKNCIEKKSGFNFFTNEIETTNLSEEIFLPKDVDSYIFLDQSIAIYIDREKENLLNFLKK